MPIVKEDIIATMLSTAYTIPSLFNISKKLPLLDIDYVMKFTNMYTDEIHDILRKMDVKPLPMRYLKEDIYILCGDILIYLGRFSGGLIPSEILVSQEKRCRTTLVLHSHPVPLPLPTLEDFISSSQLGYSIECVISKVDHRFADMLCIEPRDSWNNIIEKMGKNVDRFYSIFKKYIVFEEKQDMLFVPFPNKEEVVSAIDLVNNIINDEAEVIYAGFDMKDKTFVLYPLPSSNSKLWS